MKRIAFIFVILFAILCICLLSANADDDIVYVTWNSGEAAYFIGAQGNSSVKTTKYHSGHVITSDDLPKVYPYAPTSDKYHYEWQGAVGTTITKDMTFNLVWVSNYEGYYTVIWRSALLYNYYLKYFEDAKVYSVGFFCDIDLVEAGHIVTKDDIERHSAYEKTLKGQSYCFEWNVEEGYSINDNTAFLYGIKARDEDNVAVLWYNNMPGIGIRLAGDTNENHFVSHGCCFAETFPKGHVLKNEELPTLMDYNNEYLYSYNWDGALDAHLTESTCFMLKKERKETATVKMYLDGEIIYDKTVQIGTRITLPAVVEGHEDLRIYGWRAESGAGYFSCEAGEVVEINFDIIFDAKCVMWGDITHNGVVNTRDAVVVLKRIAEGKDFKHENFWAADMDENNVVNTRDAVLILQLVASR